MQAAEVIPPCSTPNESTHVALMPSMPLPAPWAPESKRWPHYGFALFVRARTGRTFPIERLTMPGQVGRVEDAYVAVQFLALTSECSGVASRQDGREGAHPRLADHEFAHGSNRAIHHSD
jgi:hypothetical protein